MEKVHLLSGPLGKGRQERPSEGAKREGWRSSHCQLANQPRRQRSARGLSP